MNGGSFESHCMQIGEKKPVLAENARNVFSVDIADKKKRNCENANTGGKTPVIVWRFAYFLLPILAE